MIFRRVLESRISFILNPSRFKLFTFSHWKDETFSTMLFRTMPSFLADEGFNETGQQALTLFFDYLKMTYEGASILLKLHWSPVGLLQQ